MKTNNKFQIYGLQAVAVGAIILYHAQITIYDQQLFKGGSRPYLNSVESTTAYQKLSTSSPATMSNPVVFFDITADGAPLGRIEMTVRGGVEGAEGEEEGEGKKT